MIFYFFYVFLVTPACRGHRSHVTSYKVIEQIIDVVSVVDDRPEYGVLNGPFIIKVFYEDTFIWGSSKHSHQFFMD